jgi:tetratricopeptide (TPR) repeat protein
MMKKIICLLILFLCVHNYFFGEEIVVTYIEGMLEIRVGTTWKKLFEEDIVKRDATVRLSDNGIAELTGTNICITISEQGTYNVGDMIAASQKAASFGLEEILTSKALAIFGDTDERNLQESQAGVRAGNIEDEIGWIDDADTSLLLESGRKKMKAGNYMEAINDFNDALEYSLFEKESIFLFYIAYCYDRLGKEAIALSYLTNMEIRNDVPFYPDYVLVYGRLLLKSFAYAKALELFTDFPERTVETEDQTLQGILYLTSICYIQLGQPAKAKQYLHKTKEIDPASDTGKKASKLLKTL